MPFTVDFGQQFLNEWSRYLAAQRVAVANFVSLVKAHGLDQTKLPGKLSASWLNASQADYAYAVRNSLWHYHVGYPTYRVNAHSPMTSEWLVHFQHIDKTTHITVVDLYEHYTRAGNFYIPRAPHVTPAPTQSPVGNQQP